MDISAQSTLTMTPTFAISGDVLTVDYESQDEKDDSEYQVAWSNRMDKGNFRNASTYKKAHVLLLRWADTCDDLEIKEEVNRLKDTFEKRLKYNTQIEVLDCNLESKLQVQVNHIVANFVHAHDGTDTLLIVYYAGHGKPGSIPGELEFFGQRSPNDDPLDRNQALNRLVWNQTEELLRPAAADILEIFDCCHAGTLGLTRGQPRNFEYLGAAEAMEVTPLPGDTSFTSALIWALERLLATKPEGRFTTSELLAEIRDNAPHFPQEQHPVMRDRESGNQTGRIMLHPLQDASENIKLRTDRDVDLDQAKQYSVTLHFDFAEKPSVADVNALGDQFNRIFERNALQVNGIRWGGVNPSMLGRVIHRLQAIKSRTRRMNAMKLGAANKWLLTGHAHDLPTPSPEVEERMIEEDLSVDPLNPSKRKLSKAMDSIEDPNVQENAKNGKRRKLTT